MDTPLDWYIVVKCNLKRTDNQLVQMVGGMGLFEINSFILSSDKSSFIFCVNH